TGFAVEEVEHRVNALAAAISAILLWQRDAPAPTAEQRGLVEASGVERNPVADYLVEHYRGMMEVWQPVQALAARVEGRTTQLADRQATGTGTLFGAATGQQPPGPNAGAPTGPGPSFGESDLKRALDALDLVFQDEPLPEGEGCFRQSRLVEYLRE